MYKSYQGMLILSVSMGCSYVGETLFRISSGSEYYQVMYSFLCPLLANAHIFINISMPLITSEYLLSTEHN